MSFYNELLKYKNFDFNSYFENIKDDDILRVLAKENITEFDFLTLLSEKAEAHLEEMAQKSRRITMRNFGKVVFLYTPMYLGNYCVNQCAYCSFNVKNDIARKKLNLTEVKLEAEKISETGLKHILILTGESRIETPVSYVIECVNILKNYFKSISVEIYPLEKDEYKELVDAGVDGLTVYQEVYDETTYEKVHLKGPKRNYQFRLDAPQRGGLANMRSLNIGALLGLDDWRREVFFTGLHGAYLQNIFPDAEVGFGLPRIRPHVGEFQPASLVTDKNFVQIVLALRIFQNKAGITISTRESSDFRDNLIGLGVTRISAGSTTEVGGHSSENKTEGQFDILDERSVEDIKNMIYKKGYQPVFKDWMVI